MVAERCWVKASLTILNSPDITINSVSTHRWAFTVDCSPFIVLMNRTPAWIVDVTTSRSSHIRRLLRILGLDCIFTSSRSSKGPQADFYFIVSGVSIMSLERTVPGVLVSFVSRIGVTVGRIAPVPVAVTSLVLLDGIVVDELWVETTDLVAEVVVFVKPSGLITEAVVLVGAA